MEGTGPSWTHYTDWDKVVDFCPIVVFSRSQEHEPNLLEHNGISFVYLSRLDFTGHLVHSLFVDGQLFTNVIPASVP